MLIIVLATVAYAGEAWVFITKGQGPQLSNAISLPDPGAEYEGWNSPDSGHNLIIGLQHYTSGVGWATVRQSTMVIGGHAYEEYPLPDGGTFRVQLNPALWYTDCIGSGVVRDLQ